MKLSEVAELFLTIKRFFPSFDASTENAKEFERYLRDVPFEIAKRNLDQHIMTCKWPPTIADLRGNVADLTDRDQLRQETESFFAQLELWRKNASPPPLGLKEQIHEVLRGQEK